MKSIARLALLSLMMAAVSLAADLYPNQPKLSAAHRNLMAARRQMDKVDVSGSAPSKKALTEATVSLNTARKYLEDAAKNKGSHRTAAIDRIDKAKSLIQKLALGSGSASSVVAEINMAVTDVKEAARAGRR